MPGVVKQACNSSTWEGQAGGLLGIQKDTQSQTITLDASETVMVKKSPGISTPMHTSILITSKHQLGRELCSPL